jgi:hypothetical protein
MSRKCDSLFKSATLIHVCLPVTTCAHTGDQTATNFNADTHCKLFQQTFKNTQFEKVSNFAVAQVADSTPLNPKVAHMLGIKHIACRNNCLNLGCKDMEKHSAKLKDIANMTQEVHRKVKASNMLTAELENVQVCCRQLDTTGKTGGSGHLKMKVTTRWNSSRTGKLSMTWVGLNLRVLFKPITQPLQVLLTKQLSPAGPR